MGDTVKLKYIAMTVTSYPLPPSDAQIWLVLLFSFRRNILTPISK